MPTSIRTLSKAILTIALFATFQSCKKSDVAETAAPAGDDIAALQQSVANSFGAPAEAIVYNKAEKHFVLEEDAYVSLEDARRRFGNKGVASGANGAHHQEHFYLVVPEKVCSIKLYADASVPATWLKAVDSAIASWNRVGSNVKMERIASAVGATTTITTNYVSSSTIASAAYPDYYGNPGNKMTINTAQNAMSDAAKRNAMAHELGHIVGLAHTNSTWGYVIEGTPTSDGYSVMNSTNRSWSKFTVYDLVAIKTLYPLGTL